MFRNSRIGIVAVVAVIALLFSNCENKQSNTSNEANVAVNTTDSLNENNKPIFDDPSGEMDSLFRAKDYVYSKDVERAAESGDIDATRMLATMYAYGIGGVKADRKKAYILYRNLAEQKDPEAQAYLGYIMLYGLGPVQDLEQGLKWLEESANQRYNVAFYYLGQYFEQTGDMKNAKVCYQNALALGLSEAQANIDHLNN